MNPAGIASDAEVSRVFRCHFNYDHLARDLMLQMAQYLLKETVTNKEAKE